MTNFLAKIYFIPFVHNGIIRYPNCIQLAWLSSSEDKRPAII